MTIKNEFHNWLADKFDPEIDAHNLGADTLEFLAWNDITDNVRCKITTRVLQPKLWYVNTPWAAKIEWEIRKFFYDLTK